jgi:hypothetical protein
MLKEDGMNKTLLMLVASVVIAGCSSLSPGSRGKAGAQASVKPQAPANAVGSKRDPNLIVVDDGAGPVVVRKVELRPGISSATVEKLGRSAGCVGSAGAGLVSEKGPVEVYRMQCDNGKNFLAKCELRQCKPMR